jgi:protein O-GlcNAc transferase
MLSIQNFEFELQKLLKEKEYSKIIFEITSKTKEEDRNAGLFVLLGISRMSLNNKNKDQIELAVSDFKKGYLKEKTSENSLNALVNYVLASAILSDFENTNIDFDEIRKFYNESPKSFQNKRSINIAMTKIYKRLNDYKYLLPHLEKIIKARNFMPNNLCNYGYWRCFDKSWSQNKFFEYGKFVENNLIKYPEDQLVKISSKKNKKIKLGILSADLYSGHSITFFLKTILLNYDKNKIEIYLFANEINDNDISTEIYQLVYKTINISKLSDLNALNKIRELNLDIMIDLMGYTSRNRIGLFKNRIAKKQLTWMGYCNTTGLKNMDYIISDHNLIKPNEEKFYLEKVKYLPEIWNCHEGFNFERKENLPPFLKNNYITFGSFNNPAKINEDVVDCWSKILRNIKNSKLIIKCGNNIQKLIRIEKLIEERGISKSVIFHKPIEDKKDHLNLYKKIDIALDTFPYNGVTTSFEAIWMGVPVLTMAGYNFNSRCGESINKNLNLEYLIAKDEEEYVSKAINLSNNTKKFLELRKFIYFEALKSPLFDQKRFAKSFFKVLEEIAN